MVPSRSGPSDGNEVAIAAREALTIRAVTAELPIARRFVRDLLEPHVVNELLVNDLVLVASELVTNAIEYSRDDMIEVEVSCRLREVELSVRSHGNGAELAPSSAWAVADITSITGRGLGIVRALVDQVEVRRHDDAVTITVRRNCPAGVRS